MIQTLTSRMVCRMEMTQKEIEDRLFNLENKAEAIDKAYRDDLEHISIEANMLREKLEKMQNDKIQNISS